jgi:hypothetical protein
MAKGESFFGTTSSAFSRTVGYISIAFGALFLLVGFGWFAREINFGRHAVPAAGTIVDLRVSDSGDGPTYTPVVEFKTSEGRTVRFEGISTNPPPERGISTRVLYRPEYPEDARIDRFIDRWLFPSVFTPLGLGGIGIGLFAARKRRARRGETDPAFPTA